MSILSTLTKLLTTGVSFHSGSTRMANFSVMKVNQPHDPAIENWASVSGKLGSHKEKHNSLDPLNRQGEQEGYIESLEGSYLFSVTDVWSAIGPINNCTINLEISVGGGELEVSYITADYQIVRVVAKPGQPATINGVSKLMNHSLQFKLQALTPIVSEINYRYSFAGNL